MESLNVRALCGLALLLLLCPVACHEKPEETDNTKTRADFTNPPVDPNPLVDYTKWDIRDGQFFLDGKKVFLKIAKPLVNYASEKGCQEVLNDLDLLREKYYNTIEMNCYWHHFDTDGDGVIDQPTEPLRKLVDAIYAKGMYPCIGVETYSVGGGTVPGPFWTRNPDAFAVDSNGQQATDTEYGFGTNVVSLFHPAYLEASRTYIANLAKAVDTKKVLWFETTVEPQYMGDRHLCYSDAAKARYAAWRKENGITDKDSEMPDGFPIPATFVSNATWNRFRAQSLADWVNGDAAAWRSVAGPKARVAVDYLDASSMINRDGDPIEFLRALTCADIIQVNWHWIGSERKPNSIAYERVRQVMQETGRPWAISEHMTIGGIEIASYGYINKMLEHTLEAGTRLGWEFVNVRNRTSDTFSIYNDDWSPKTCIRDVDENWGYWLWRVDAWDSGNP